MVAPVVSLMSARRASYVPGIQGARRSCSFSYGQGLATPRPRPTASFTASGLGLPCGRVGGSARTPSSLWTAPWSPRVTTRWGSKNYRHSTNHQVVHQRRYAAFRRGGQAFARKPQTADRKATMRQGGDEVQDA